MTAVRWKCAWRFNVVLVFLLAWHSKALDISTDEPYTPYKSSDDKYDFVDVAQQQGEISQSETGQTSRFFTSGDVDETFWLKHLGEDFKHAIHLQVGGEERCNGVFNMSENGAAYKVQDDTINNPVQENEVKLTTPKDKPAEEKIKKKVKNVEGNKKMRKVRRKHKNEQKSENDEKTVDQPKTAANTNIEKQQTMQDTISVQSLGATDQMLKQSDYKDDLKKYKRFQHINLKYAPENNMTDTKESNSHNDTNTKTMDRAMEERPVVVNLPESNKQIELETNDAPVVVKMPPVIYHSQPTNVRDPDNFTDNTETNTQIHATQTQGEQGLVGELTQTDNTQYTQTPMIFDQQQHEQYTLNQHFQQTPQKQQTQYPIQMTGPQYATQYQQTTLYDQQQQPIQQSHQQYPSPSYASTNYYNQGVYATNINTIPIQQPNTLQSNNILKSDYMPSKRTVSSYGEYDAPQAQSDSIYQQYGRGSGSNSDLYQQGL